MMNKYKVAETIATQILADLKTRVESGTKWDVGSPGFLGKRSDQFGRDNC